MHKLATSQKLVSIYIAEMSVSADQELHGSVAINYPGRFDSVVVNSQIENSSDVFSYISLNGKKINHPYARLSVFKTELGGRNTIDFIAKTKHIPTGQHSSVKFRVSIIQEHKEVANDVAFTKVTKN